MYNGRLPRCRFQHRVNIPSGDFPLTQSKWPPKKFVAVCTGILDCGWQYFGATCGPSYVLFVGFIMTEFSESVEIPEKIPLVVITKVRLVEFGIIIIS